MPGTHKKTDASLLRMESFYTAGLCSVFCVFSPLTIDGCLLFTFSARHKWIERNQWMDESVTPIPSEELSERERKKSNGKYGGFIND